MKLAAFLPLVPIISIIVGGLPGTPHKWFWSSWFLQEPVGFRFVKAFLVQTTPLLHLWVTEQMELFRVVTESV